MLARRFAILLALIAAFGISLAAQETPDANASSELRLTGAVRTAEGIPVPGATLRAIQTSSGKAWVSWTDENGKFEFPALPPGHYRIEISQLGFAPATRETDLSPASQAPLELSWMWELSQRSTLLRQRRRGKGTNPRIHRASSEAAKSEPSGAALRTLERLFQNQTTAAASNGAPGGAPEAAMDRAGRRTQWTARVAGRCGPGGGRRAFQQVGLNAQNQNNPEKHRRRRAKCPGEQADSLGKPPLRMRFR